MYKTDLLIIVLMVLFVFSIPAGIYGLHRYHQVHHVQVAERIQKEYGFKRCFKFESYTLICTDTRETRHDSHTYGPYTLVSGRNYHFDWKAGEEHMTFTVSEVENYIFDAGGIYRKK